MTTEQINAKALERYPVITATKSFGNEFFDYDFNAGRREQFISDIQWYQQSLSSDERSLEEVLNNCDPYNELHTPNHQRIALKAMQEVAVREMLKGINMTEVAYKSEIQSLQQQLKDISYDNTKYRQHIDRQTQQLAEKDKEIAMTEKIASDHMDIICELTKIGRKLEKKFSEGYEYCKQYYKIID